MRKKVAVSKTLLYPATEKK